MAKKPHGIEFIKVAEHAGGRTALVWHVPSRNGRQTACQKVNVLGFKAVCIAPELPAPFCSDYHCKRVAMARLAGQVGV